MARLAFFVFYFFSGLPRKGERSTPLSSSAGAASTSPVAFVMLLLTWPAVAAWRWIRVKRWLVEPAVAFGGFW
jgi:hypothetical protein